MKKAQIFILTGFVIVIGFISFKTQLNNEKQHFKKIIIPIDRKIKTFDPALAFDDDSLTVIGQALDTLFQYHYLKRPYELIPSLAAEMPKISNNGRTYIIKLKKNIQYHDHPAFSDGPRIMIAKDFENAIKRIAFKPLQSVGTWLFQGKLKGFDEFGRKVGDNLEKMLNTKLEGITVIDDFTLKLDLLQAEPNLNYFLALNFTSPVPEELIRYTKNDLSDVLIGTGAYRLKEVKSDEFLFTQNEDFRSEKYPSSGDRYANTQRLLLSSTEKIPFIRDISFKVLTDNEKKWSMLLNGEVDILSVPKELLSKILTQDKEFYRLLKDKNISVKHFSKLATRWIGFNMKISIFSKGESGAFLRKAVAHAIDVDLYNEVLSNNTNLKANSIFNPSISGYDPSHFNTYKFNMSKAREYLIKAGHPDGKGLPVIQFVTRGTQEVNIEEAKFIQSQLESVGFKVKLKVIDFGEFLKLGRSGRLGDLWVDNWIYDYPDAENVLQLLISKNSPGINKSQFENTMVDKLYSKLSNTLEPEDRFQIMYEIEDIIYKELPWVMLTYESSYILQSNRVQNFRKSYFIKNYVKYLKKN